MSGLKRHLDELLGTGCNPSSASDSRWTVRSLLSVWYRPNFNGFLVRTSIDPGEHFHSCQQYPYKPVHVSQPKERRKIFLVTMSPERESKVLDSVEQRTLPKATARR